MKVETIQCPKCGSENLLAHSKIFSDLYECKDCHHEFRL